MNFRLRSFLKLKASYFVQTASMITLYFFSAKLGLMIDAVGGFATLIWAPTGIAFASLFIFGIHLWPAIAIGAFLVNLLSGAPVLTTLGITAGNTLEAITAVYLIKRFTDFHSTFDRLKDIVTFVFIASLFSTLTSATIGTTSLWLSGIISTNEYGLAWRAWWLGDALGNFVVAPFILVYSNIKFKIKKISYLKLAEALLLTAGLLITCSLIFESKHTLAFWLFPFVVWTALRFGQAGSVAVVLCISVAAVWGTTNGHGPFAIGDLRNNLFLLHSFIAVIANTGLILAASLAERKEAISASLKSGEALKEAIRTRDAFISIASHELKTPLTSLSLQIQMAKERTSSAGDGILPPDKLAKVLDVSNKQINRLTQLIEDLLDVSRINAGKFNFKFERMNLSAVVRDMVDRSLEQFKKVGCSVETSIQENVIGQFDHARIEQIMDNLLSNVVKYAPGKPVEISLSVDENQLVTLTVQDHGPGVPTEKHKKIFERFERASDSTNVSGLGLGLFIVKEIAKGHQGTVHIESSAGVGSKFVIKLPLKAG